MTDRDMKVEAIEHHVEAILSILGVPQTAHTEGTPHRVAKMYVDELFNKEDESNLVTTFPATTSSPVSVETTFHSLCAHHMVPFMGKVVVTYLPDKHLIGLSKIPRIIRLLSKGLHVQEDLTDHIGQYLVAVLVPKYLKVELKDVTHLCVSMRGVKAEALTTTVFEWGSKEEA